MIIGGTVYRSDGKTAAPDVIVYAYQTNAEGFYVGGSGQTAASRRHGRLRGWVRSGADGRYEFETIKPAPYPNNVMPAHVHMMIVEPGRPAYWIDDIVFAGEFGVDARYRARQVNRGGSGIINLRRMPRGDALAVRDIVLERHP